MNSSFPKIFNLLRQVETKKSLWTEHTLFTHNIGVTLDQVCTVCQSILNILDELSSGGGYDDLTDSQSGNIIYELEFINRVFNETVHINNPMKMEHH
jgi:hypothetical protein